MKIDLTAGNERSQTDVRIVDLDDNVVGINLPEDLDLEALMEYLRKGTQNDNDG